MEHSSKIYIAGHQGLVGSALYRLLTAQNFNNLVVKTQEELDLRRQQDVEDFFATEKPEYVFLAAARVGGIKANIERPADFIYDNIAIATHVIHAAYTHNVKKLLFFGSSCIYPRNCPQPISEEYLMTGLLEQTNEPYALAKIAGIKLCHAYNRQYGTKFITCMPTNLYGIHDTFDVHNGHVIPALIAKISQADQEGYPCVDIWGSGQAVREFLYVDDLAQAALFLMREYQDYAHIINIGTGHGHTIMMLAYAIADIIGYNGRLFFDTNQPEGVGHKVLDVERMKALGWHAHTTLLEGLQKTISWYQTQHALFTRYCEYEKHI
ncbi:MAG: GDP-L-fucose synthase [Candidatus Babeliaceae bacterium]|jgi:GDP-L-fucose synthase